MNRERLRDCGSGPNCVCTEATKESHRIDRLLLAAEPDRAFDVIDKVMSQWPRATCVESEPGYRRYTCKTRILRFADDVELLLDGKFLQMRSASRLGYSDLGVNRRRMRELRSLLVKSGCFSEAESSSS